MHKVMKGGGFLLHFFTENRKMTILKWFQFGDGGDGLDGSADSVQPKGRWAQRFDQNLAFKSQLDLSQIDDDMGEYCLVMLCLT